jgi:hypothetical protein
MSIDRGQAVPFYFENYADVRTGRPVDRGMPKGGFSRGRHVGDIVRRVDQ